jgi:hypothetical protein
VRRPAPGGRAEVAELADAQASEACGPKARGSSNLPFRTNLTHQPYRHVKRVHGLDPVPRSHHPDRCGRHHNRASIVSGTWNVSNGELDLDRMVGQVGQFYGAILARRADIDRDFVFTYDPSAALGSPSYANFTRLRSWTDP